MADRPIARWVLRDDQDENGRVEEKDVMMKTPPVDWGDGGGG